MIYPLGCQIVIRNLNTGKQEFLRGHENNITCMTMSKDGKYLASGQVPFSSYAFVISVDTNKELEVLAAAWLFIFLLELNCKKGFKTYRKSFMFE